MLNTEEVSASCLCYLLISVPFARGAVASGRSPGGWMGDGGNRALPEGDVIRCAGRRGAQGGGNFGLNPESDLLDATYDYA